MTANFVPSENRLGLPQIAASSTTQGPALGTIIRAADSTTSGLGEGEFIYLLGVASTAVGSVVTYSATTFQTALVANTAKQAGPLAVAMSANGAGAYGWYQISGLAVVKKSAVKVKPNVPIFISSTSGRLTSATASGLNVLGARAANLTTIASATSTFTAIIDRPHAQGATA